MAEPKTRPTRVSVAAFLAKVPDPVKRADSQVLVRLMREVTGAPAKMWGPSIVGFGSYRYLYSDNSEREWPVAGFSPRKDSLVLYVMAGFPGQAARLKRLGKHKTGKSCLYVKRLSDVDMTVLREIVVESVKEMRRRYPA